MHSFARAFAGRLCGKTPFHISTHTWLYQYQPSTFNYLPSFRTIPGNPDRVIKLVNEPGRDKKVGWLCWGLTSQSTISQSCRDGAIASWVINQYFRGVKCLAQGHNTATVGLEPRTSRSGVRHSTTEPPRSPWQKGAYCLGKHGRLWAACTSVASREPSLFAQKI